MIPQGACYWFDYGSQGLDSAYASTHQAVPQLEVISSGSIIVEIELIHELAR